jgi:hypothetical protein
VRSQSVRPPVEHMNILENCYVHKATSILIPSFVDNTKLILELTLVDSPKS